jgi:hypothetical protein
VLRLETQLQLHWGRVMRQQVLELPMEAVWMQVLQRRRMLLLV